MRDICSFSIYSKMKCLWKLHCNLNLNMKGQNLALSFAALTHRADAIAALQFYEYCFISVCIEILLTQFAISIAKKDLFLHSNSAIFKVLICENRNIPSYV